MIDPITNKKIYLGNILTYSYILNNINIKNRKKELNNIYYKNKIEYKSYPRNNNLNNNNNINNYENNYVFNYNNDISSDLKNVMNILNIKKNKIYDLNANSVEKNIKILNKNNNTIITNFNFDKYIFNIYKMFYLNIKYLVSFIYNEQLFKNENGNLFKKNTFIYNLSQLNIKFNIPKIKMNLIKLKYEYIFNLSYEELNKIHEFVNKDILYRNEFLNDNLTSFINKLYSNTIICELYDLIFSLCGLYTSSETFDNIENIYMENKDTIININKIYSLLLKYYNNLLNTIEYQAENERIYDIYINKEYKKLKKDNNTLIKFDEFVENSDIYNDNEDKNDNDDEDEDEDDEDNNDNDNDNINNIENIIDDEDFEENEEVFIYPNEEFNVELDYLNNDINEEYNNDINVDIDNILIKT